MDSDEIRFSFLADDLANQHHYRLADALVLDTASQSYRLVFAKFPFQRKELTVSRDLLLQCVREDRLAGELAEQIHAALSAP